MKTRTNAEWLCALKSEGEPQTAALSDLRAYLLRAARYSVYRSLGARGQALAADIEHLAEDAAQDALAALLEHLEDFRGESRFTTWAYSFAVNAALIAARRERWGRLSLDRLLESPDLVSRIGKAGGTAPDPERAALQDEILGAIREAIAGQLTQRQQQALTAVVFEGMPLDELARQWGSNRNALYKLLHDARRKLKAHLRTRGFDTREVFEAFGEDR